MSWYNGRDGAIVRQTSYTGYNPILSVKSPAGSWEIGTYTNDSLFFNLIADGNYANAVNSPYMQVEMRNNGTLFVNGRSAFTATTLYANGTGTNGTVYLGAAASVYTCFRIIYRDNDWVYGSVDVIWPDGKIVDLPITTKTTYDFWFKVKTMTISGTTITNRTQGCISPNLSTGHWSTQDSGANNIYVVAVIGYVF